MFTLANKNVLVFGLDVHGVAASELLARQGARVVAMGATAEGDSVQRIQSWPKAEVITRGDSVPKDQFDFAVLSPEVPERSALVQEVLRRELPLISCLELSFRVAQCLAIAVAGTNGKGTTAEMIARILAANGRKAALAGNREHPACAAAAESRHLDFLIFQASASQLKWTDFFRPAVAVLLNVAATRLEGEHTSDESISGTARLFRNQQAFDWAIIQSEALTRMRELHLAVPAKIVTFSAQDPAADLYLDRGLLISRLETWPGPLFNMDHCQVRGPHFAEDIMAALAVGHALRLSLENMADSLKTCTAGRHRCELVAEIEGVQFINDAKSANVDALHKALLAARPGATGEPNVLLIAGGRDEDLDFHYLGPALSQRVKRAFVFGAAAEKIRAAWSLFTPCTVAPTLVEALWDAARSAGSGDVVLFSPACSSLEEFRNYQEAGERFCAAVKSISSGASAGHPNRHGETVPF